MAEYRYILERKSKKHRCPACGKLRFVRYIESSTGQHLAPKYGRCDRENNCGYWLKPDHDKKEATNIHRPQKKATTYIPDQILRQTQKAYDQNTFIQNLLHRIPFPISFEDVMLAVRLYQLGTITKGSRKGAITFPFIDQRGNVRTIQAKQFDETNHTASTDFLHSMLSRNCESENKPLPTWLRIYLQNEKFVSCLFGEHLLKRYINKPIALVEAPKTAIISTLYFGFPEDAPDNFLWLAVYNLSSLTVEKCRVLHGRDVVLFPDLKAFDKWNQRAKELQAAIPETTFKVSDYLERKAPESDKVAGLDLADYLVKFDWRLFRPEPIPTTPAMIPESEASCTIQNGKNVSPEKTILSKNWDQEIEELEGFFRNIKFPHEAIRLKDYCTIEDGLKFIVNHINFIKANNGNKTYLPYLERLRAFKDYLSQN